MPMEKPETVESYISGFDAPTRQLLKEIRVAIRETVPEASEKISYGMPTFYLEGNLLHYAAYEKHIGLYATPSGQGAFAAELSGYKQGKGSVQFPLDQPLPIDLIKKIAAFRAEENRMKASVRKK